MEPEEIQGTSEVQDPEEVYMREVMGFSEEEIAEARASFLEKQAAKEAENGGE